MTAGGVAHSLQIPGDMRLARALPAAKIPASSCHLNLFTPPYTVQYSTNLVNWLPLGPATPRYLFTDTNAPAGPQRYYRLSYP